MSSTSTRFLERRPSTAGHFELQIDGHKSTAYVKSVEGGYASANTIDEAIGPENARIKHTSTVDIDPFTIDLGLSGTGDVLRWIQSSWRKEWSRRNGQITHADFNFRSTHEHEFFDALITETTLPTLDGASREAAYLKVKIQPEKVVNRNGSGKILQSNVGAKQKTWSPSCFRIVLDGIDGIEYTNKIESFTIKQGIKKLYTGIDRFPQIEPTKIEFPNISGTIALAYADKLLEWGNSYIKTGMRDTKAQREGAIEFLAPYVTNKEDRRAGDRCIFRIKLSEVGVHKVQIMPSTANSDQIKRVKFELYVGAMDLDSGRGFESGIGESERKRRNIGD